MSTGSGGVGLLLCLHHVLLDTRITVLSMLDMAPANYPLVPRFCFEENCVMRRARQRAKMLVALRNCRGHFEPNVCAKGYCLGYGLDWSGICRGRLDLGCT